MPKKILMAAPNMKKSAAAALARAQIAGPHDETEVSEEAVRKLLVLSEQEIAMLNAITNGRPPRNAQAILAGIRLKLEYSMKKPEPKGDGSKAPVSVTVNMLGPKPEEAK